MTAKLWRTGVRLLIGVPVHNEENHIEGVLADVRRYCPNIFAVNDGSVDRTAEKLAAIPGIVVHTHEHNEGYGQSIIDIFDYARTAAYDWVVTLDADEQHEPKSIADFERGAAEDRADIISGSRYMENSLREDTAPSDRRWINCQITELLRDLTGYQLTDSFCGYKAYRVASLGRLALTEKGYAFPLQFWAQAARAGLRVVEIPVKLIYKDANRRFGGGLDDPAQRLKHYLEVLSAALGREVAAVCDGRRCEYPCR
jgi:glycosyltransferase involved in cell wall biosynthesis